MEPVQHLPRLLARTALLGCVLMAAIIVSSAFLRLSSIGIGCEPWPQCYGRLSALDPAAMNVMTATGIARLLHRLSAMAVAVVATFALMLTLTGPLRSAGNVLLAIGLCLLTVLLAIVGRQSAGTLVPLIGLINLVGGFSMLGAFWLLWLVNRRAELPTPRSMHPGLLYAVLGLFVIQVGLGALVSVTYSAFTCSTLLNCQTSAESAQHLLAAFDPTAALAVDSENRVLAPAGASELQRLHRFSGFALGGLLIALGAAVAHRSARPKLGVYLAVAAALELTLGVVMVIGEFPLSAALLHNVVAALLLVSLLALVARRYLPGISRS